MSDEAEARPWWKNPDLIFKIAVPISIAAAGFIVNWGMETRRNRQATASQNLQREAGTQRLYTELMTRRQEAESGIRKSMFVNYIGAILKDASKTSGTRVQARLKDLDDMTLKLELLAYNFHESINLKPLFLHMVALGRGIEEDIEKGHKASDGPGAPAANKGDAQKTLRRIRARTARLAKYVVHQQSWVLARDKRCSVNLEVSTEAVAAASEETPVALRERVASRPATQDPAAARESLGDSDTDGTSLEQPAYDDAESDEVVETKQAVETTDEARTSPTLHVVQVDGIVRHVTVEAMGWDEQPDEMKIKITINEIETDDHVIDEDHPRNTYKDLKFTLSHYDFPMVDNIRLSHNQRCAVILRDIDRAKGTISIQVLVFPGHLASRRLQPYFFDMLSEVDQGLKRIQRQTSNGE